MAKIAQNLIILIEPTEDANDISFKAGNMLMNRFSIDEDDAFEIFGVYYLKNPMMGFDENIAECNPEQGMGYLSFQSTLIVHLRIN